MKRVVKGVVFFVFVIVTLLGGLFGIGIGVNYSHTKLAFFVLSIPTIIGFMCFYFYRFQTIKLSLKDSTYLFVIIVYSSGIGGGYLYLVNALGVHDPYTVSGPVLEKKYSEGRSYRSYGPNFRITFKDENSEKIYEIELSSYEYNRLKIGDNYAETMYRGSLGLLYRQKT